MYDRARMFTVVVTEKEGPERRVTFTESEVTIGRVPGNDVVLPKGNVSKRHSRIVLKDNRFIVVDLKSTNGTYVNGRKITSPLVVKEGDKIYVGDYVLTLENGPGDLGAQPPPSALDGAGKAQLPSVNTPLGRDSMVDEALPPVLRGVTMSMSSMPATSAASADLALESESHDSAAPLLSPDPLEFERSSREQERPPEVDGSMPALPAPVEPRPGRREGLGLRPPQENTPRGETLLGPIDFVLADPDVFHVVVERYDRIRADRGSGLKLESAAFVSPDALVSVVHEVKTVAGVPADAASYDVSLANGLHVVAVLPAAASNGPVVSVRRRPTRVRTFQEQREVLPQALGLRIEDALRHKRHVWIVGPSGTDLAAFASSAVAACGTSERVALFERAPELALGDRAAICLKLGAVPVTELLERVRSFRADRLVMHGLREDDLAAVLSAFAQRPEGNIASFEARSAKDALATFDRVAGDDVTLRAVSLLVELKLGEGGKTRVAAAYDIELDASGDLALKAG